MGLFKGLKNKKWFRGLMQVAPAIAAAAGGPLAGMAVQLANRHLGGDKQISSIEELGTIITGGDPDDLLKLRDADQAFEIKLKDLDIDIKEIGEKSIQGAREMQEKINDPAANHLSYIVLATFGVLAATVLAGFFFEEFQLEGPAERFVFLLIGLVGSWVTQIMNFRFGSSRGSLIKTIELSEALKSYISGGRKV